jgi:WD40 repeat protein
MLLDTATGEQRAIVTQKKHTRAVAISPDDKLLAVAGDGETIEIYEIPGGGRRHVITGITGPVFTLRLHIGDIGFVETRAFSAIKTLALIAVPVSVFALVVLIKKECQTGPAVGAC